MKIPDDVSSASAWTICELEEEVERLKATIDALARDATRRATEGHKRELYYIDKLAATGRWLPKSGSTDE